MALDDKNALLLLDVAARHDMINFSLEQRPSFSGSVDQILDDLRWLQALEIHTVFFDLNISHTPVDDQLRHMEVLQ